MVCDAGLVRGVPDAAAHEIVAAVCASAEARGEPGQLRVSVVGDGRVLHVTVTRTREGDPRARSARIEADDATTATAAAPNLLDALDRPAVSQTGDPSASTDEEGAEGRADTGTGAERRWYGWQTLLCDAATAGLVTTSIVTSSGEFLVGAVPVYLLGAPTVHILHGRALVGLASLGLRAVAPLGPAALGAGIFSSAGYPDGSATGFAVGAITGFGVGAIAVAIVDAAVLAREPTRPARGSMAAPSVVPTLASGSGDARIGVAGTF